VKQALQGPGLADPIAGVGRGGQCPACLLHIDGNKHRCFQDDC